jgi:hypothetical protein
MEIRFSKDFQTSNLQFHIHYFKIPMAKSWVHTMQYEYHCRGEFSQAFSAKLLYRWSSQCTRIEPYAFVFRQVALPLPAGQCSGYARLEVTLRSQ